MPYEADLSNYGLSNDVLLAGWFAAIPFSFDAKGAIVAKWDHLLLICKLVTQREANVKFRAVSSVQLARNGNVVIKMHKGDAYFSANSVIDMRNPAEQEVGSSATLWQFRGKGEGTSFAWKSPDISFPAWGAEPPESTLYGWAGEVEKVGKLSYILSDWDGSRYYRAIHLLGPSGSEGAAALAKTVVNCMQPFDAGDEANNKAPAAQSGTTCAKLTVKDGRRDGRNLEILGDDPGGIAQVLDARGCVWFAHGTFAGLKVKEVIPLVFHSHKMDLDLSYLLGDMSLAKTMELEAVGEPESPDLVFEGLSLWNLNRRGDNKDKPILL